MLDVGDKCICSEPNWWSAFGEKIELLEMGKRLTVSDTRFVAGMRFLAFKGLPQTTFFLVGGFTPLRALN